MQLIKKDATIRMYEKENQKMAFKSPIQQAQALVLANPTDQNAQAPIIQAKPQRFTRRPRLGDYGLSYDEGPYKEYRDEYYYYEPKDINEEIKRLNGLLNDDHYAESSSRRLNILTNPSLQKYLNDRSAYNSQFDKDYKEYYPTAKEAIIRKLLADGDLFRNRSYGNKDYREADDLGDSVVADFAKKYGYENEWSGDLFSPLRQHGGSFSALGKEEKDPIIGDDGYRTYRTPYDKNAYIGELLRSGELTLDELKAYILGK